MMYLKELSKKDAIYERLASALGQYFTVTPMTHAPEIGTENPYKKTCTGFLQVCRANRYGFFLVPKSGTE